MPKKIIISSLLILLGFSLCLADSNQQDVNIPKFYKVDEGFYRGGCPNEAGIGYLKRLGVKTMIDFRGNETDVEKEKNAARQMGMIYVNIPFRIFRLPPKDDAIKRFLRIVTDEKNKPVFIHCKHGRDRTGLMVAVYRIAIQGRLPKQALEEASAFGLRPYYLHMKWFILHKAEKFKNEKD